MTDTTTPAGAMPAAAGATPAQSTPVSPAAAPAEPATGDPDALGEGGKAAIVKERAAARAALDRATAAETELANLKTASQTETERAIAQAKKEGAESVSAKLNDRIRRSEARASLLAAGANAEFVDLAVNADEFKGLKVSAEGEVEGLEEAIATFKKSHGGVFAKATAGAGSGDLGTGSGQGASQVAPGYDRLSQAYAEIAANPRK
jgi:hypothetical protein